MVVTYPCYSNFGVAFLFYYLRDMKSFHAYNIEEVSVFNISEVGKTKSRLNSTSRNLGKESDAEHILIIYACQVVEFEYGINSILSGKDQVHFNLKNPSETGKNMLCNLLTNSDTASSVKRIKPYIALVLHFLLNLNGNMLILNSDFSKGKHVLRKFSEF